MYEYLDPRSGSRPPMRADGRGQALRRQREANYLKQIKRANEEYRRLKREQPEVSAPVLDSLVQLEEVCSAPPKFPVYKLAIYESIRDIGRVVFGSEGYNRVKTEKLTQDIGPHFDAYAGHFSPWTIHLNNGGRRVVKATFLPPEMWAQYVEDTEGLTQLGAEEQKERFILGRQVFDSGGELTTSSLNDGDLTLLWHGNSDDSDAPPPSVHEFTYNDIPNLILKQGSRVKQAKTSYHPGSTYSIYARQDKTGDFDGFVAV